MSAIHLVQKIYQKFRQLVFFYSYIFSFKKLGKNVYFLPPFRFDGVENISINKASFFQRGVWLYCVGIDESKANLIIGEGCNFGYNNHITCVSKVVIGDYVLTANNVYISDNLHEYQDVNTPILQQPVRFKREVNIGSGSWLGENVSVIGASIGRNSVIGANSVVTRDVPDYCVAVGAPAKVIKYYDQDLKKWINV